MIVRFAQYHTQGELTPACRHQLSERDGHSPFTLSRSFPTIQSHPTARCTIPWSPRYRKDPPRSRPRRLVEEWRPKHQYVAPSFHSLPFNFRPTAFYMRKGADALSKWVGEAERQLRLLFDEAKASQPSIIFFDEIDGLAPVRSSKQDQIHASIVSTLLALMDGMDGRGNRIDAGGDPFR